MYTQGILGPPAALFRQHDVSLPRNLTMHFSLKALPRIPNPHPTHNPRLVKTEISLGEGISKPSRGQNWQSDNEIELSFPIEW